MAKKRITELATETTLKDGQYVAIDHATDGTKKLNLGAELTDLKEDLDDVKGGFAVHEQLTFESATGYYNKNGAFYEYSGIKTMSLDVNAGDISTSII